MKFIKNIIESFRESRRKRRIASCRKRIDHLESKLLELSECVEDNEGDAAVEGFIAVSIFQHGRIYNEIKREHQILQSLLNDQ
jgi:hypothetical protein